MEHIALGLGAGRPITKLQSEERQAGRESIWPSSSRSIGPCRPVLAVAPRLEVTSSNVKTKPETVVELYLATLGRGARQPRYLDNYRVRYLLCGYDTIPVREGRVRKPVKWRSD